MGSQDYILIKDDYEEGFNGLTELNYVVKTQSEGEMKFVKRDDPNGEKS